MKNDKLYILTNENGETKGEQKRMQPGHASALNVILGESGDQWKRVKETSTPPAKSIAQRRIESLRKEIEDKRALMADRQQRIAAGQTDMEDCFVSERSNQQAIDLANTKIEILENGGLAEFDCLRDLETGEVVSTKRLKGQWGWCWRIDDAHVAKFGKFVGDASRESTYTRKGLKSGTCMLPAWACFDTYGTGMAGAYSAFVKVFPSNKNYAIEE